jgi:glycine hydroxymethyltransferase
MKKIAYFIKKVILDKINPKEVEKEVIGFRKKFQKVKYCIKI